MKLCICNLLVCDYMPSSAAVLCMRGSKMSHARRIIIQLHSSEPHLTKSSFILIQYFVQLCISCINSRNTYAAQYMYILSVSYLYTGCNKHDIASTAHIATPQKCFTVDDGYNTLS